MPTVLIDKSTLIQGMAWCRQATSHNLNQCWLISMSPMSKNGHQNSTGSHRMWVLTPVFPLFQGVSVDRVQCRGTCKRAAGPASSPTTCTGDAGWVFQTLHTGGKGTMIGHVTVVTITGTTILVLYLKAKSLQFVWRTGIRGWNLRVLCPELTTW